MGDPGHSPRPSAARTVERTDPLDVIELATAMLVRNLEMLRRRSDIYTELDRAEYLLLRTLDQVGPADICTLAAALGLDPSTVGRQVAAMQGKGLVQRSPAATDRRRSIVSPTEQGRGRMATTLARRREGTGQLLAGWSDRDLRALGEMFSRYNDAVARMYLSPEAGTSPEAGPEGNTSPGPEEGRP